MLMRRPKDNQSPGFAQPSPAFSRLYKRYKAALTLGAMGGEAGADFCHLGVFPFTPGDISVGIYLQLHTSVFLEVCSLKSIVLLMLMLVGCLLFRL